MNGSTSRLHKNGCVEEGTEVLVADISRDATRSEESANGLHTTDSFGNERMSEWSGTNGGAAAPLDGEPLENCGESELPPSDGGGLRQRRKVGRSKYAWGGKFITNIEATKGNFSLYSDQFSVEGLHHAFDSTNSRLRTSAWIIAFLAFGTFFLFMTVPMVKDYQNRMVVTSIDSQQGEDGLPLPIVTICPRASGIKCDCLLWRKLHCRYRYHVRNLEWMERFDEWSCYTNFDHSNLIDNTYPTLENENCNEFSFSDTEVLFGSPETMMLDACGVDEEILQRYPETRNMTLHNLYDQILAREGTEDGPFITAEETILYAGMNLRGQIKFMDSLYNHVPSNWVHHNHIEWGRSQICSQLRPPNGDARAQQRIAGAGHGLKVLVHGIQQGHFPLRDMAESSPAVDVHINVNQNKEVGENDFIMAPRSEFFDVAAGFDTTIEYETTVFQRHRGWGSEASQTCTDTKEPRQACVQRRKLELVGERCGCKSTQLFGNIRPEFWASPDFLGCSVTRNTTQGDCFKEYSEFGKSVVIPYGVCPNQCQKMSPRIVRHTNKMLSDGQLLFTSQKLRYSGNYITSPQTVLFDVGLGTMDIEKVTERPVISLPGESN